MIRTNLCPKPAETLTALDGDPSNWQNYKNGSMTSLQPGQYVASCNVTETNGANAAIQYWDEVNRVKFFDVSIVATGVNVMRFDVQTASDSCHFSVCGCTATNFLVERADTYDTAIGGASGLLHRGHDASRIGASVGRVMSDDGHEPDKQSKTQRHAEAGRVHADFDHREYFGYLILVHGLAGRVGRLRHDRQLSRHLQQEPTHRMGLHGHDPESDEHELQGRVRQSDRQGVEHGPVQAGRIPGEQGLDRRPLLVRRGYDATRLTLLGAMA